MNIILKVKQPGRKQALIENKVIVIEDIGSQPSAQRLIEAIVQQQVEEYNSKPLEKNILPFLSQSQTEEQAASGKINFGSIYNENKADFEQAKQTALQAFEDGMFAFFVNDEEITSLATILELQENSIITFIRLTFLAGSYW
ncbi:hypothetical protein [Parafilimonas terrae]|jgi:hypothetical protein|uniref:Uncharacterized protein n=1 Tax=Parafilimonas terrae TaxID=1465490 RepID=A0A1I5R086_9BACT|nr:hypothetical protein [Parafilimonas terrae]SFP51974.1 hypothetical protein SAMN05444277_1013 [Parafilimonas terrae]